MIQVQKKNKMKNIAYINGNFVDQGEAFLSIFDRSILFSDAVYEVICVWNNQFLDYNAHVARLQRSLEKLNINYEINSQKLLEEAKSLIQKNHLKYGLIYLQVTRGAGIRDFIIGDDLKPNFFMFCVEKKLEELEDFKSLKLKSFIDKRWGLCDIKTTQLLYASIAKSEAKKSGKDDAIFVKDGFITEASSANFYIIDQQNRIITPPLDGTILPGITRSTLLLKAAKALNIEIIERKFSLQEAQKAKEAFISSASSFVWSVASIDDKFIGDGGLGAISKALRLEYFNQVERI